MDEGKFDGKRDKRDINWIKKEIEKIIEVKLDEEKDREK